MINREKIKKFVKDNKKPIIEIAGMAAIELFAVATYTVVCGNYGYRMVKPLGFRDDEGFWVKTISGKELVCRAV